MKNYAAWGQEYLEEAEAIKRRIQSIRTDPDAAGDRAQRIRLLYDMYLECTVTGHTLQRRGENLVR